MEGVNLAEVQTLILTALQENGGDLDDMKLRKFLTDNDIGDELKAQAINSLINKSRVQILQRADKTAFFKLVSEE